MESIRIIYAAPPLASQLVHINGLGVHELMKPCFARRPRGTGDYLFALFHDAVQIEDETGFHGHPPETMAVWGPEHGHHYGLEDGRWDHSWIHCDGPVVEKALAEGNIPLNRAFHCPHEPLFTQMLSAIFLELREPLRADEQLIVLRLQLLIRELSVQLQRAEAERTVPPKLLKVKQYLDVHYQEPIQLEDLAAMASCSVPHFSAEFKRCFGTSAIAYVIRLRLHKAVYLLADVNLPISEIAETVGYQDMSYFSRHFKRFFGINARDMRRQLTATPRSRVHPFRFRQRP